MCNFEQKVLKALNSFGIEKLSLVKLGVAVSGGADSVSLLLSLTKIIPVSNLFVITVNHNIRQEKETAGDAAFVVDLCRKLSVFCKVAELPRGKVFQVAEERKQGIEEAARSLRYCEFENFVSEYNLDYLCLAHNKNDQLETLLMRFLNGGSTEAASGIPAQRKCFIRPLLQIKRLEIEDYLKQNNYSWRTDSTNTDTAYLRNNIRHNLIPVLQENFPDWENAVLAGAERFSLDSEFITAQVDNFFNSNHIECKNDEVEIPYDDFFTCFPALQNRILLKACSYVGESKRIPNVFLNDFRQHPAGKKVFDNVEISVKKNIILVKKCVKTHTESMFSAIIEEDGNYQFPFGVLKVCSAENGKNTSLLINNEMCLNNIELPVCIRNAKTGDEVECADGKMKKVFDIFSDWHVPVEQRCEIPVIQKLSGKKQEIVCIFGSICGFNNWIVYEKVNS